MHLWYTSWTVELDIYLALSLSCTLRIAFRQIEGRRERSRATEMIG
jgi:hypothetical protein